MIFLKRITSLCLSLLMLFGLTACGDEETTDLILNTAAGVLMDALDSSSSPDGSEKDFYAPEASSDAFYTTLPEDGSYVESTPPVEEGEAYYDLENVVLYLEYYGELPDNYITKSEARALGWSGGSVERYLDDAAIGGDHFGNYEGLLPQGSYTECDLNTLDENSRGAVRLIFSDDGQYYYTDDHYESFTQVWVEDGEVIFK